MKDKDQERIEMLLQKSIKKHDVEPFQERWDAIESELDFDNCENKVVEEKASILVGLGVDSNSCNDRPPINKKSVFILTFVCLILVLAIILPICLNKKEQSYFSPTDLVGEVVTEDEFYEGIEKSGINLVDLTKYQCQEFSLLKTNSGEIHGGNLSINDDIKNEIVKVSFFSKFVSVPNYDFTDPEICKLNNLEIQYKKIDNEEDVVQYKAYAKYREVTYKLDYYCLTDNLLDFFNNFFA